MDDAVKIYTLPGCVQCTLTRRALDEAGIRYEVVDLASDPAALAHVKSIGFLQAPAVEGAGEPWSGFRPDRIDELIKSRAV